MSPLIKFFLLLITLFLLSTCDKDDSDLLLVKVTTDPVTYITRTGVSIAGSLLNESADTVIAYGFCWSARPQPTYADNRIVPQYMMSGNSVKGTFKWWINGLTPGTTYYLRAYAITERNKFYGNEESFTTKPATGVITFNPDLTYYSVTDIDGNSYKTIRIGTQEWMAENLKTTRFNDGTAIPLVTDDSKWIKLSTPGYCWFINDENFKNIYGGYYNWFVVGTGKLCPAGWHVPIEDDWTKFKLLLGMTSDQIKSEVPEESDAGNKIKETGTVNWPEGSVAASNETGFTAVPGGSRYDELTFGPLFGDGSAGWWSSTITSHTGYVYSHWVSGDRGWFYRTYNMYPKCGLNVRCIKD